MTPQNLSIHRVVQLCNSYAEYDIVTTSGWSTASFRQLR